MFKVSKRCAFVSSAFWFVACSADGSPGPHSADAFVGNYAFPTDDSVDAASCDPLLFEQILEASSANVAKALDPHCINAGFGRRALVFDALCAHDEMCAVHHKADCQAAYEVDWQERLRPRGLSVPCMDAQLDSMSCLAQAACDDAQACDAASSYAKSACDPNAPVNGESTCPQLPESRELTKGPIPEDAINRAGMVDETRVPDFIPAYDQRGEVAGYVRYCATLGGGTVTVYGDDLKTIVGHMLPGHGFVPSATP